MLLIQLASLTACLALTASSCQPRPRQDLAPRPTLAARGSTERPPVQEPKRSVELTLDGPVTVDGLEQPPIPGDPVLIGAWPRAAARIDLDEQTTPVRGLLQRFARLARLNFVLHDGVRGEVTAALAGVPWTQALRAILVAKDLVAIRDGNVVRILPRVEWARERKAATR